jgi:hypothetical protein
MPFLIEVSRSFGLALVQNIADSGTIAAVSNIASVPKKGKCKVILRWGGLPFSNFVHLHFRKYKK